MRVTGIFNNNFLISARGINAKQKTNSAKTRINKVFQQQRQNNDGDTFVKKDKVTTLHDKHGQISSETFYKEDEPYKSIWYDGGERAKWVRYFDGSFNLSRNAWYEWKKAPLIELTKEENGVRTMLYAKPAVKSKGDFKGEVGGFEVSIRDKNERSSIQAKLFANPDGTYSDFDDPNLPELKTALEGLLELINTEEYADGFGGSYKFNNGVKDAIKYIESKEN